MKIQHYEKVNNQKISLKFTDDFKHRSYLKIPFNERNGNNYLCIIGQNPSNANKDEADKTLAYLEEFVFKKLPQYSGIIMLNLFSRIDTTKKETVDLERNETNKILIEKIQNNTDFLLVFGSKGKDKAYNFHNKLKTIQKYLEKKNLYKIDIGHTDYPPHPGNPKILYNNFNFDIVQCKIFN